MANLMQFMVTLYSDFSFNMKSLRDAAEDSLERVDYSCLAGESTRGP